MIQLDEKTAQSVQEIVRNIEASQERLRIILQTVINFSGNEGEYTLSPDLKSLVKVSKDEV